MSIESRHGACQGGCQRGCHEGDALPLTFDVGAGGAHGDLWLCVDCLHAALEENVHDEDALWLIEEAIDIAEGSQPNVDTWPCVVCEANRVIVGEGYIDDDGPKCDACVDAKLTRGDVLATRGA